MPLRPLPPLRGDRPSLFRGVLRDDRLARELYSEGAGIARCLPLAVAVPADAADIPILVQWARQSGHTLMPRGSASGMAAGAIGPGIAVDLSRLNWIGSVDVEKQLLVCGPGALRGDIDGVARNAGLRFPVDPSSGTFCTIGGMAAANAAGARSLHFGATRSWVSGLECVFDDGSLAWVRRGEPLPLQVPAVRRLSQMVEQLRETVSRGVLTHAGVRKESSGYALNECLSQGGHLLDILVGSEGTLGIFTAVEVRLTPAAPATATVLAHFDSLEAATECALRARAGGATACELLDRTFLELAASEGAPGVPSYREAVLLLEVEGVNGHAHANALAQQLAQTFRTFGASDVVLAHDRNTERQLWALRHAASPIMASLAPRLRSMQFIEDGCVPPDRMPAYVRGVRTALKEAGFPGVIFGHAGDAHIHVNPLVDVTLAGWKTRVRTTLGSVCELTGRLGGTLAGEHGDGRLRAPLLHHVWSAEARAAFMNIKAAGDPAGVFNRGCKIADPGDDGLEVMRHDPGASPLGDEARLRLDWIEKNRAWNSFRLEAGAPVVQR